MKFVDLDIPGPVEIQPSRFADDRGYFSETYRADRFGERIGAFDFLQDNQSLSTQPGTIRGLHFQTRPAAQGKLVQCIAGSLFDVAVDLRTGSAHYGRWIGVVLSPGEGNQLWIPPGFAHGFCTLEPNTVISYKVTAYYSRDHDHGVAWDDPDIGIQWPDVAAADTLSPKDRAQPALRDLPQYFTLED